MSRSFTALPHPLPACPGRPSPQQRFLARRSAPARRRTLAWLPLLVLAVFAVAGSREAAAHTELTRAEPPPNGVLAAPPSRLELWFTEPVTVGYGSPTLRLINDAGKETLLRGIAVDPVDTRRVTADVVDGAVGSQTVVWALRALDGHTMFGSFAFRVGDDRAPGAADVENDAPTAWGVVTRWLTFLGAALVAGGYVTALSSRRRLALGGTKENAADPGSDRRLVGVILGGALLAVAATLAEPLLTTVAPPGDAIAPDLSEALGNLAGGWWLRLTALALSAVLAVALLAEARRGRPVPLPRAHDWVGLGLALAALVGFTMTAHGAARDGLGTLAFASNLLHQWSIALLVGVVAHLGLVHLGSARFGARRPESGEEHPPAGREPASVPWPAILALAAVGVGSGVANTSLVLPAVDELWTGAYGTIALLKTVALVPMAVLGVALVGRRARGRAGGKARGLTAAIPARTAGRVALAVLLLIVLGGSTMVLLAAPGARAVPLSPLVDLAAPAGGVAQGSGATAHVAVQPARTGSNALLVRFADASGAPLPPGTTPPVRFDAVGLDHGGERLGIVPTADSSGAYAIAGLGLDGVGWWRFDMILSPLGQPEARIPFYLVLPDPNLHGGEVAPPAGAAAEAGGVYARGLANLTSLHRVRWTERLANGTGDVLVTDIAVSDGSDGRPAGIAISGSGRSMIQSGDRRWTRAVEGPWLEEPAGPPYVLANAGRTYAGARAFRLGRIEPVDGEDCQVVTFVVPTAGGGEAGRHAWWVGVESGRIRRMAMVAPGHYMVRDYRDFDAELVIAPPPDATQGATPAASPVLVP